MLVLLMNEFTKANQALNMKAECCMQCHPKSILMEEDNSEIYVRSFGGKQCCGFSHVTVSLRLAPVR